MRLPGLLLLTCALGATACNSSSEMRETTRDASDATDENTTDAAVDDDGEDDVGGGDGDAGARDAGVRDGSAPSDAAVGASDAGRDAGTTDLESFVYVGGWDRGGGAYPFRAYGLDRASGALSPKGSTFDFGQNPSFVAPSADGRFLYIANESWWGKPGVTVAAVSASDGIPTQIDNQPLEGGGALVFTSLAPSGMHVLAADYNSGRVVVYPVASDGKLGAAVDTESFDKPASEDSAQTHSVRVHPSGKWVYAPNKARNEVAQLAFDAATGKLTSLGPVSHPGGPRHVAFDPNGTYALVNSELGNELTSYRVGSDGKLTKVDVKSTLPSGFSGTDNKGAHVLVHPSGKYVYASNRGAPGSSADFADSIAVFALASDGKLSLLQHVESGGAVPRNFDIDSTGTLMVVANQGSEQTADGTLVVFAIGSDGKLTPKGAPVTGLKEPNAVAIITRPAD